MMEPYSKPMQEAMKAVREMKYVQPIVASDSGFTRPDYETAARLQLTAERESAEILQGYTELYTAYTNAILNRIEELFT